MAEEVKDAEWLKSVLVDLLENAKSAETVDHAACCKYADILWKMLPRNRGKSVEDDFSGIRKQILEGGPKLRDG